MKLKMVNPMVYLLGRNRVYFFLIAGLSLALIILAIVGIILNSIWMIGIAFFAYVVLGEISNVFITYLTQKAYEN
jgi:hypothetical protein